MTALPLHEPMRDRLVARLPAALEMAVLALLALQAARLIWLAVTPLGPVGGGEVAAPAREPMASLPTADVFFRSTASTAGPASLEALGLRLFGVRSDGTRGGGGAILATSDGAQAAFRTGDEVARGVVLASVGADHAILASGGQRHRIDLPHDTAGSGIAAPAGAAAALPTGVEPQSAAQAGAAAVDPRQLLAEAGLRRTETDGVAGYRVIPRGDGALLRQAGLQPGDLLLSINGQPLTPERLGALNDELSDGGPAVIAFRRDGQTRSVSLQAPSP